MFCIIALVYASKLLSLQKKLFLVIYCKICYHNQTQIKAFILIFITVVLL